MVVSIVLAASMALLLPHALSHRPASPLSHEPPLGPGLALRSVPGRRRSPSLLGAGESVPVYRPERALQPTAFVFVLSVAIVALAPTQHLIAQMGAARATRLLSLVSSASALTEILLAPLVGALSDSVGRKPVLMLTLCAVLVANGVAALVPSVVCIALSRFVCNCVVGLYFLSAGASLGDAYRTDQARLASSSGSLYAVVNGGFAVGIACSRFLPSSQTLRWGYAVSSAAAAVATGVAAFAVKETMEASERVPFRIRQFNPVSCVRLFASREMGLLALLLALALQPIFMGDVLQVFAINEWALTQGQTATLFTLIPVLGALGNVVGGRCVKLLGVQLFTAVATLSNMIFWLGCCVSHRAALAGACIGFLGPARTLGASTSLTVAAASKGIPQGQLSGDRSNLIAILKVIGPAVYGQAYVRGKAAGLPVLPFCLNLVLTFAALLLGPLALRAETSEPENGSAGSKRG